MPRRGDRHDADSTGLSSALPAHSRWPLVIGAPGRAQAQDDSTEGNSIWNLEQRVWGGIVRGLGLQGSERPDDRLPRAVAAGGSAEPRPAAAAGPRDRRADSGLAGRSRCGKRGKPREAKRKAHVGNASTALENQGRPIAPDELNRGVPRQQGTQSTGSNAPAPGPSRRRPVAPVRVGLSRRPVLGTSLGLRHGLRRLQGRNRHLHQRAGTVAARPSRRPATRRRRLSSPMA